MKVIPKVIPKRKTPKKTEGFERWKASQVRILVPRHCKRVSEFSETLFYLLSVQIKKVARFQATFSLNQFGTEITPDRNDPGSSLYSRRIQNRAQIFL